MHAQENQREKECDFPVRSERGVPVVHRLTYLSSESQSSWGMSPLANDSPGNMDYLAAQLKPFCFPFYLASLHGNPLNVHFCLAPHLGQPYLIALRIWVSLSINLRSKWSHYNQCSYQQAKLMVCDLGPSIKGWIEWILVVPYVHSFFIYWTVLHQPQFKPSGFTTHYYNLFEWGTHSYVVRLDTSLVHLKEYCSCGSENMFIEFGTPLCSVQGLKIISFTKFSWVCSTKISAWNWVLLFLEL